MNTDIFAILYKKDDRKVNAYGEISIDNELYRVPDKYIGQRVNFYINPDGDLMGSSKDGKDTFDLIPVDPANATGKKLHDETVKEQVTKEPLELEGAQKIESWLVVKVKRQTAKVKGLHSLTPYLILKVMLRRTLPSRRSRLSMPSRIGIKRRCVSARSLIAGGMILSATGSGYISKSCYEAEKLTESSD
ncbi:hypothetical protein [Thiohalophilus sp.]|uniref:hypothetical protein n=1 Tax=Thiohalophilus sp. TaxID=3028392 RepID=UPI002ACDFB96|nr:hypothetical protein [Thiohalophilus sp.]MDZ7802391.1 hypothetical protein [Thiohalophilus sp.]